MSDPIRIVHNVRRRRYELFVGSDLASVAEYREADDTLLFDHTETLGRFRGRGLAARLVGFALDDVREQGRSVTPTCWFVADYIHDHPDYRDLLAAASG
jgi:predicted GNAT family acetyltransferase